MIRRALMCCVGYAAGQCVPGMSQGNAGRHWPSLLTTTPTQPNSHLTSFRSRWMTAGRDS